LPASGFVSGWENKCILDFSTTDSASPVLPSGLKWSSNNSGVAPTAYSTASGVRNRLVFTTMDGGTTWEAEYSSYGAVEMAFVQPALGANGTLGGSSFAVYASAEYTDNYAYKAADNNASTEYIGGVAADYYYTWYNPAALKVSSISMTNRAGAGNAFTGYTLYSSNDNSSWTTLVTGTNSTTGGYAVWTISVPSEYREFYKYYKLYISSVSSGYSGCTQATLNATYMAQ